MDLISWFFLFSFFLLRLLFSDGALNRARVAQKQWSKTTFAQRKQFLQLLNDFIIENQESLARIASRDSGKTAVDAAFGEILTTCEKIRWTIANGEDCLQTEYRSVCWLMVHKTARVEYIPLVSTYSQRSNQLPVNSPQNITSGGDWNHRVMELSPSQHAWPHDLRDFCRKRLCRQGV